MTVPDENSRDSADADSSNQPLAGAPASDSLELKLPDDSSAPRDVGLWAGVLVLLTFAVYWPMTGGTLLWNDLRAIDPGNLGTIWVQWWAHPTQYPLSQYHPLAFTVDWIIFNLFGRDANGVPIPFGFHLVSLICHCVAAVLLWRVLRQLRLPAAWLAAAVFALHPLNAEAVSWMNQLDTVLAGALLFGSIYCYLRFAGLDAVGQEISAPAPAAPARRIMPAQQWGWYAAAAGLFILAILSKAPAWAMPIVTLAALWWRRRRRGIDALLLLPMLVLGLLLAWQQQQYEHIVFANAGETAFWSLPQHGIALGRTFWIYLGRIFWPAGLSVVYPLHVLQPGAVAQWMPLVGMAVVLAGVIAAAAAGLRAPLTAFIGYVAFLLPGMGVVHLITMRDSLVADHEAYLATAPIIALVIGILAAAVRMGTMRNSAPAAPIVEGTPPETRAGTRGGAAVGAWVALSAVLLIAAGGAAWAHSQVFADPLALWTNATTRDPDSAFAHDHLALAYAEAGELAERAGDQDTAHTDSDHALRECQIAAQLDPRDGQAQSIWGRLLSARNDTTGAIQHLSQAVRLDPKLMGAREELGAVLIRTQQYQAAIAVLDAALARQPRAPLTHRLLGEAFARLGQLPRAMAEQQQAIDIDPQDWTAREDLANLMARSGDDKGAIAQLSYVVRQKPRGQYDPALWNALGKATARTGDMATAIQFFKAALSLDPTRAETKNNLDLAHEALDAQHRAAATRAATRASATQPAAAAKPRTTSPTIMAH